RDPSFREECESVRGRTRADPDYPISARNLLSLPIESLRNRSTPSKSPVIAKRYHRRHTLPVSEEMAMKKPAETLFHTGTAGRQIHVFADVFHRIAQHAGRGAVHSHPAVLIHGELVVAGPAACFQH